MRTKLNLGCGPHAMVGWTNLDIGRHTGVIQHDLTKPLPFEDKTVDLIYSEHFIEHLTLQQGEALFRECIRVMKRGAVIRISTPNLQKLIALYLERNLKSWSPTWNPSSPCRMVNEGMREWGHQFLYDQHELREVLYDCGFSSVQEVPWHCSNVAELRELEVRPYIGDLIVEAVK